MAFLGQSFDVGSLPAGNKFDPLPPGWYTSTISGAELKRTKDQTGKYISIKYTINDPNYEGRIVFGNLNIKNKNQKAEEIARQQLGEIMRALGLARVEDTDQLVGGNLKIKLDIRTQEGYEPSNDVRGFKAIGGSAPPPVGVTKPVDTDNGKAAPPWARK